MGLREFLKSIVRNWIEGLRRNKLPAALSAIALIVTTALALTSDFDERPRYRQLILPEIRKAAGVTAFSPPATGRQLTARDGTVTCFAGCARGDK